MSSHDDRTDDAVLAAQQVQAHALTWWVRWSPQHRRFEAWELTDPAQCRIVCASSAGELWDRMQQVDLDLWRARPRDDQPPTPGAVDRLGSPLRVAPGRIPDFHGLPSGRRGRFPGPRLPSTKGPGGDPRSVATVAFQRLLIHPDTRSTHAGAVVHRAARPGP